MYKLPDGEFFPFIENAINDELTPAQKNWASGEMRDIARDLSKDDTGLADLDEAKPMQEITMKQAMAAAAILLGTTGTPNTAKAQNFQGLKDKFKQGVTAVQNKLKKMSIVRFIADLHLGHQNMATRRGFSTVEEHDEHVIAKWNSVVKHIIFT